MNVLKKILTTLCCAISLIAFLPIGRVHADTDKTALQTARDGVLAAIAAETDYWDDSYAAFETDLALLGGIAAVDALLADPLATQVDVDAMTDALTGLLDHLITEAVHNQMFLEYLTARTAVLTAYTLRSRAAYALALDEVQRILEDETRIGDAAVLALGDDLDAAALLLEPLADKTALNAAIGAATAIDGSDGTAYTPSSFTAFRAAYAAFATALLPGIAKTVNDVVADADASVAEAAAAVTAIESATALLLPRPDKTALIAAYESAVVFDLSGHTPSSAALFTAGLVPIKTVIDDADALGAAVAAATADLIALYAALVPRADKTDLERANNEALVAYYEERSAYTTSSYALFRAAVIAYGTYLEVNQMLVDADVSQAAVDAKRAEIEAALALLTPRADVSALAAAHESESARDLEPYTPSSADLYRAGLAAILLVIADADTDQTEADAAFDELVALAAVLVEKADKAELTLIVADGNAVREAVYSNSSYQVLARLLLAADTLLEDDDATQADVDLMRDAIAEAIDGLALKTARVVIREGTAPVDVDTYVAIGGSSVLSYTASDPEILAIDADGNVTGLKYGTATVTVLLANGITEEITFVVKAKIQTATMIYAIAIPVVAAGTALAMIFWNDRTLAFLKRIRIFRKAAKP